MKRSVRSYVTGFVLSGILSVLSFIAISERLFPSSVLLYTIIILAFLQFLVQLVLFLHLGKEKRPRWQLIIFISTFSLVLIIIIGSIWIMDNLKYNMSPQQINSYMQSQDGF